MTQSSVPPCTPSPHPALRVDQHPVVPSHHQPHAAPAASSGKQIWGNEVDYEPVLLTHNEGPDAEPTSPMTKVHAGPDVPWSYASIPGD